MARTFDERELSPVFKDPSPVVRAILGHEPSPSLVSRLHARRGRRSPTEQPTMNMRDKMKTSVLFDFDPSEVKKS